MSGICYITGTCLFCVSVGTTLGGKSVVTIYLGTTIVDIILGVYVFKISDSSLSADVCVSPSVTNGMGGAGFFRSWINSCATCIAASMEDIFGMVNFLGMKSTV